MPFVFAGQFGPEAIIDSFGNSQPGAPVALLLTDGLTLATCYTDRTKAVVAQNPTNADSLGNVTLFADPGQYLLRVVVGTMVTLLAIDVPVDPFDAGGAIAADLAVETAARIAADSAEQAARIAADTAETANRIAGDLAEAAARAAADLNHTVATTGVHGVGSSTVENTAASQAKADAALAAAKAYVDALQLVTLAQLGTTLGQSSLDVNGNVTLDFSTPWGIHIGVPYYDSAGAAAGDEAVLVVATDGSLHLVQPGVP